jgi:hypothetical protein
VRQNERLKQGKAEESSPHVTMLSDCEEKGRDKAS